jgi:hypothetical protein
MLKLHVNVNGWAHPPLSAIEVRRARRRRDMELLSLGSMEAALHMVEHVAGRLPACKAEVFEHVRDPLAALGFSSSNPPLVASPTGPAMLQHL